MQDFAVKEQQGAERLVLGGGRYFALNSQVSEAGFNFGCAHLSGVTFVMEVGCVKLVEGTAHGQATPIQNMSINHRRLYIRMTQ